jgi:hypothetical protein
LRHANGSLAPHGDVGVIDAIEPLRHSDEEWIRVADVVAFPASDKAAGLWVPAFPLMAVRSFN